MPLELRAACGVIVGVCPLHHVVGVPDRSGMVLAGGVYAHGVDTEFPHFRLIRADPDRRGNDLIHGLHRLHAKFCGLFNPHFNLAERKHPIRLFPRHLGNVRNRLGQIAVEIL